MTSLSAIMLVLLSSHQAMLLMKVLNKRNYHKICKLSNRICREYGLEESMPTGQKAKSYKENKEE